MSPTKSSNSCLASAGTSPTSTRASLSIVNNIAEGAG
jgi:hypothetical protein